MAWPFFSRIEFRPDVTVSLKLGFLEGNGCVVSGLSLFEQFFLESSVADGCLPVSFGGVDGRVTLCSGAGC